jgi:hypothetical protein
MRIHALLTILIVTVALCATVPRLASARQSRGVTAAETERAVLEVFNTSRALQYIDEGFASGALTWDEAKALYSEQTTIRSAYIQGKVLHGPKVAARRAAFMLRMSQGTFARLAFNADQRRVTEQQVTWLW